MIHKEITTNDVAAREEALLELAPDIFSLEEKTVLYIGANDINFSLHGQLHNANYKISVIELDKSSCDRLKKDTRLVEVINEDIVKFTTDKKYDIIIWWGGPEHIHIEDLGSTLKKLDNISKYIVAMMCPWGISTGNPEHYTIFVENMLEKYGYECIYIGEKDKETLNKASGIVAVKHHE